MSSLNCTENHLSYVDACDSELASYLQDELLRQEQGIELIASEN
eukprot:COSAG05_NODE_12562_length_463_cov_0.843407_2_plen_43_part_01